MNIKAIYHKHSGTFHVNKLVVEMGEEKAQAWAEKMVKRGHRVFFAIID